MEESIENNPTETKQEKMPLTEKVFVGFAGFVVASTAAEGVYEIGKEIVEIF